MQKITALISKHKIALFLGLCVAILSIAPQIFFMHDSAFRGIQMSGADAEEHYIARVQEVYDGYLDMGNVFLSRYKEQPYITPGLGEILQAWIGKIFFLDAVSFNVLAKFIFPFVLFLLFYDIVYQLFSSRTIALLSSSITFLGYNLLSGPTDILGLFVGKASIVGFLTYARPVNPEISSLLLFSALLVLISLTRNEAKICSWRTLSLGVMSGALIYISIYPWMFLFGMFFLYGGFFWYQGGVFVQRIKALMVVVGINLIITLQFWFNFLALHKNSDYLMTAMRQGLVTSHLPVISWWLIILTFVLVFAWPRVYKKETRVFLLLSVIALWISTNQHVITGVFIQPQHFHWYITKPLIALIVSAVGVYVGRVYIKKERIITALVGVGIGILFYNGFLIQTHSYHTQYGKAVELQKYAPVLSYLRTFPEEKTIWAGPELSLLIPMYTKHNAPNNIYAGLYLSSDEFYKERLFLEYKLFGVAPKNIYEVLQKERVVVSQKLHLIYYREKLGSYAAIPDNELKELAGDYNIFYQDEDWRHTFQYMHVDSIVWDMASQPAYPYPAMSFLKEIYEKGSFVVYSVGSHEED